MPRTPATAARSGKKANDQQLAEIFGADKLPSGRSVPFRQPTQPVSKTVQRLLAQIHVEAEARTLEALSAKDGIVVLQPMNSGTKRVEFYSVGGSDVINISDGQGAKVTLYKRYSRPKGWDDWHPSHWSGGMHRVDSLGREWCCYPGTTYVTDDFGNLVDVEGGAA